MMAGPNDPNNAALRFVVVSAVLWAIIYGLIVWLS